MKRINFFLTFLLCSTFLSAQDIFDMYQKDPAASYVSVSPKMFEMLGKLSINTWCDDYPTSMDSRISQGTFQNLGLLNSFSR